MIKFIHYYELNKDSIDTIFEDTVLKICIPHCGILQKMNQYLLFQMNFITFGQKRLPEGYVFTSLYFHIHTIALHGIFDIITIS